MELEEVIKRIRNQICFDALEQGYCTHHGGKCTDLLELIRKLELEASAKYHTPRGHHHGADWVDNAQKTWTCDCGTVLTNPYYKIED